MFREVNQKEYMTYIGKLIRNGKYDFVNDNSVNHYKMCCLNKDKDVMAYREQMEDETFKNYIWEE